ncbi:hypothetical protein RIF29_47007 [Crotalaria pallida]|uniref:Uncharacterized protein n=1 Tax=Crotalaria pallida TaxID=3830 RepID=A0AAN9DWW7_CROPI
MVPSSRARKLTWGARFSIQKVPRRPFLKPYAHPECRFGCIFSSGLTDCLKKALSLLYQALELTANTGFSSFRFPIPLEHELEKGTRLLCE